MVRYYSDDGTFDGPVDKVWKLIQAHNDPKNKIHGSIVSMASKPQPDGSVLADVVTLGNDGRSHVNHKWRFTVKPPHTQSVEMVEGPMKGTWFTSVYLPEGNKTRVVTVAEWKVEGVHDEATLKKLANEFFDSGFDEDNKFLRNMH
ncbi:MAG: hypothetical protein QOE90_350 [Thermoplasmata archaeon]|jgi:hypothetical protein|nr:hypothetical protein [Thermoplasmata archaeon]